MLTLYVVPLVEILGCCKKFKKKEESFNPKSAQRRNI
jgi:hypothetical protein